MGKAASKAEQLHHELQSLEKRKDQQGIDIADDEEIISKYEELARSCRLHGELKHAAEALKKLLELKESRVKKFQLEHGIAPEQQASQPQPSQSQQQKAQQKKQSKQQQQQQQQQQQLSVKQQKKQQGYGNGKKASDASMLEELDGEQQQQQQQKRPKSRVSGEHAIEIREEELKLSLATTMEQLSSVLRLELLATNASTAAAFGSTTNPNDNASKSRNSSARRNRPNNSSSNSEIEASLMSKRAKTEMIARAEDLLVKSLTIRESAFKAHLERGFSKQKRRSSASHRVSARLKHTTTAVSGSDPAKGAASNTGMMGSSSSSSSSSSHPSHAVPATTTAITTVKRKPNALSGLFGSNKKGSFSSAKSRSDKSGGVQHTHTNAQQQQQQQQQQHDVETESSSAPVAKSTSVTVLNRPATDVTNPAEQSKREDSSFEYHYHHHHHQQQQQQQKTPGEHSATGGAASSIAEAKEAFSKRAAELKYLVARTKSSLATLQHAYGQVDQAHKGHRNALRLFAEVPLPSDPERLIFDDEKKIWVRDIHHRTESFPRKKSSKASFLKMPSYSWRSRDGSGANEAGNRASADRKGESSRTSSDLPQAGGAGGDGLGAAFSLENAPAPSHLRTDSVKRESTEEFTHGDPAAGVGGSMQERNVTFANLVHREDGDGGEEEIQREGERERARGGTEFPHDAHVGNAEYTADSKKKDLWRLILQGNPGYPAQKRSLYGNYWNIPKPDESHMKGVSQTLELDPSISHTFHVGTSLPSEKTRLKLQKEGVAYIDIGKPHRSHGIVQSHAKFQFDSKTEAWRVIDISKRGILVDGIRVHESLLNEGDSILLGGNAKSVKLGYSMKPEEPAKTGLLYVCERVVQSIEDSLFAGLVPSAVFEVNRTSYPTSSISPDNVTLDKQQYQSQSQSQSQSQLPQGSQEVHDEEKAEEYAGESGALNDSGGPGSGTPNQQNQQNQQQHRESFFPMNSAFQHFHVLCVAAYINMSMENDGLERSHGITVNESTALFQKVVEEGVPFNLWDSWVKSALLKKRQKEQ